MILRNLQVLKQKRHYFVTVRQEFYAQSSGNITNHPNSYRAHLERKVNSKSISIKKGNLSMRFSGQSEDKKQSGIIFSKSHHKAITFSEEDENYLMLFIVPESKHEEGSEMWHVFLKSVSTASLVSQKNILKALPLAMAPTAMSASSCTLALFEVKTCRNNCINLSA